MITSNNSHNNHAAVLLVVLAFLLAFTSSESDAQATQNLSPSLLHWSADGNDMFLDVNGTTLHLNPRTNSTGPHTVTATSRIAVPDTKNWRISFEIRFGNLRDQASSFHLLRDGKDIGWIGADGFYKGMGVFVGKDNEVYGANADAEWHQVNYASDGSTLTVNLDGRQVGTGPAQTVPSSLRLENSQDMTVPCHQEGVWIRNVGIRIELLDQPKEQSAAPIVQSTSFLSQDAGVVNVQENDNALYCVMGDTVHLAGTTSGQHRLSRRSLTIDGQPYNDLPASPNDDGYRFDWKPNAPGTYKIAVRFTLQQPFAILPVKDVTVTVLPKASLALQQFSKPVPASCPVAVQPLDTTIFHPARVEFFLNGQSVGAANQSPFQVTLPISKQIPGTYAVSYQAYDVQGARLSGESENVTVPVRVQLTMPTVVNLATASDKTTFTSSIVPDLKIVRVDYLVDDQRVASATLPPYSASASLSAFKSGSHSVKAEVVAEDGATFDCDPAALTLTNQPDDARQAQLAKDESDKRDKLAKQVADEVAAKAEQERANKEIENNLSIFWPRPGFDEKVFRKQAAALAYYVPEKRYGQVGKVHGLAVFSMTHNGETVLETGVPLTVSASVRSGTGQTYFLAFSEEDAKVTAQQAAEYCKTKTAFYHWDWSKYDLTVGYLENDVKNGGPSAGAADALAMMSAILNTPVDTSIAITGAITLQGQVEPVGGLGLKVESAFNDTNVHTVILPADSANDEDLIALYMTHPVLCFNRRVILARDMDEVMNQALLGWNTDSEVREEKLVQGGLRHFARGEDKQALAAFAAAKQITPENWTVDFWSAMVYAVEKQSREDAAAASGK